jgi:DedD protein
MAKDDETQTFNPKHRIVGAIVLVSLAVIFVPLLLDDGVPPTGGKTSSEIPARPDDTPAGATKVVVTPLASGAGDKAAAEPPAPPAAAVPHDAAAEKPAAAAPPAEVKPAPPPAEKKPEAPSAKPKPPAKTPGTGKVTKGWVVQVGTFSHADNAERLREKLKSHGHAVSSENITLDGGKAVRLRVGPFRDKTAAVKAQARIQKDVGVQGVVLAYP